MYLLKIFIIFLILNFQNKLLANENDYFLMLKNNKVNVRYGPSLDYPIKFIYKKKNLPVKIIDKQENFRKIIDHKKNSGWIHRIMLKKSNSIINLKENILYKKPSKFSQPLAKIESGRLLIIKKCKKNWCKVKTGDFAGWVIAKNIWGL